MLEFPFAGINLSPSPALLWGLFAAVALMFISVTWALIYHWRHYGMDSKKVAIAESIYLVGGMGMLASAFVSLLAA